MQIKKKLADKNLQYRYRLAVSRIILLTIRLYMSYYSCSAVGESLIQVVEGKIPTRNRLTREAVQKFWRLRLQETMTADELLPYYTRRNGAQTVICTCQKQNKWLTCLFFIDLQRLKMINQGPLHCIEFIVNLVLCQLSSDCVLKTGLMYRHQWRAK